MGAGVATHVPTYPLVIFYFLSNEPPPSADNKSDHPYMQPHAALRRRAKTALARKKERYRSEITHAATPTPYLQVMRPAPVINVLSDIKQRRREASQSIFKWNWAITKPTLELNHTLKVMLCLDCRNPPATPLVNQTELKHFEGIAMKFSTGIQGAMTPNDFGNCLDFFNLIPTVI